MAAVRPYQSRQAHSQAIMTAVTVLPGPRLILGQVRVSLQPDASALALLKLASLCYAPMLAVGFEHGTRPR